MTDDARSIPSIELKNHNERGEPEWCFHAPGGICHIPLTSLTVTGCYWLPGNYAYTDALLAFCAYFLLARQWSLYFIYSKITPHNEWQLIKITILRHRWPLVVRCWPCHPHPARGDKLGQYPGLFCPGGIALVIQLLIYGCVALVTPTLSENYSSQRGGGVIYGNRSAGWRYLTLPGMIW